MPVSYTHLDVYKRQFMNSSIPKEKQKQYADYVKQITPTHSLPMNMAKAFLTGGVICVVGQIITNFAKSRGLDQEDVYKRQLLFHRTFSQLLL